MAAGATIKIKRKSGAFTGGELAAGELGLDIANSKLYTSNDGASVYLLDIVGLLNIVEDVSPQLGANLDAQSFRITNLGSPVAGGDAVTKTYVDSAIQGLSWDQPVLAIQTDNTLDPGASPTTGDRYIISNAASLHANFGSITGLGDDDIVQYDGVDFIVVFDASVEGAGEAVYNDNDVNSYVYNGTAWVPLGGSADHGGLTGLNDDDHTQYTIISAGSGAPASTPPRAGALYHDSANNHFYMSKGSSSAADWVQMVDSTSTINQSTFTIDGGTI